MKRSRFLPLALAAALVLANPCGFAGVTPEEAAAGRALVARYADAVIGVELVVTLKGTINGRPVPAQERQVDVNGTVINAAGLTVLSLGSIDPSAAITNPNAQLEEPEFKEVKLRTADGTEYPARIVLKDEDLDLAFVAPETPAEGSLPAFAHVDLDAPAQGVILGNYFEVSRASKKVERAPAVRVVNVIAILSKPRQLLLATEYSPGSPVFDADGKILGVGVRHIVDGRSVGSVILPAVEIAAIAPTP
jgi:hypothetical protein